jgi:hypothetical protein
MGAGRFKVDFQNHACVLVLKCLDASRPLWSELPAEPRPSLSGAFLPCGLLHQIVVAGRQRGYNRTWKSRFLMLMGGPDDLS